MSLPVPFNLHAWINEHRHLLKPPVGNSLIWNSQFAVMIVGGPNRRTDFHIDPCEELFYQVEGNISLKLKVDGEVRDVVIREGDIFLLPADIPHLVQRPANTVGLVVEQRRPPNVLDHLRWYCPQCGAVVHDAVFHLDDLVTQVKPIIEEFRNNPELRTCKKCHTVMPE